MKGLRHGLAIGLGYLSVSFAFGMKAVADGLTPLEAVLISMTNLTSAGQVAAVPLIIAQSSLMEMALTQLIINLRYALMSISLSQKMGDDMSTPGGCSLPLSTRMKCLPWHPPSRRSWSTAICTG